jgi:hypothetical protein
MTQTCQKMIGAAAVAEGQHDENLFKAQIYAAFA